MPKLTFTLDFKTPELRDLDLPIEIRKPNSALVGTALSSQEFDLKPGRYYAVAMMPGGQQLVQPFEMKGDEPLGLTLTPQPGDESPHEWEEATHFLKARSPSRQQPRQVPPVPAVRRPMAESLAPALPSVKARVRLFAGNVLTGAAALARPLSLPGLPAMQLENFEPGRLVLFRVHASSEPLIAQLLQPGAPARNMAIPVAPLGNALLVFTRRFDGTCSMDVQLGNRNADLLLGYSASPSSNAVDAARPTVRDAKQLVLNKGGDPIAAAIGAIAILGCSDLHALHDWTSNLDHGFPWLPDGAAINAEYLARRGDHAQAATRLFDLPSRGLPVLAASLFFAVERLKWYAALKPAQAGGIDVERARQTLAILRPFALFAHRTRPITSYIGVDPAHPDGAPVSDDVTPHTGVAANESLELAEWLDIQ